MEGQKDAEGEKDKAQISLKFETEETIFTIIDQPSADIAVLLLPAPPDEFDDGWFDGQTQEHIRLVNSMGVKHLIVCVNKMDAQYADFSFGRFSTIKNDVSNFI